MTVPIANLSKVAFSTDYPYERVHMKGHVTTTLGSTASITHNLGYVPYAKVWYLYTGAGAFLATQSNYAPYAVIVKPNATTIEIEAFAGLFGTFGDSITLYYRIYKDHTL